MSEHGNDTMSSEAIFAEALAAATGGSIPQETGVSMSEPEQESGDLQDTSIEETSGFDTEQDEGDELDSEPENQDTESSEEESETSDKDLSEAVKEIQVKGKDGKRKKIKVDFSDHERMTKYVQKAANAVRLQSERDALQAENSKLKEAQDSLETLQSIVDERGFEGLIDHLNSENGGFESWMKQKMDRQERRMHATEDEIKYLDEQEKREALQRRLDLIERQQQEREERIRESENQADLSRRQSEITPIFYKYTFDGKLGDSVAEQKHNNLMFKAVTETLDSLEEQGVKITPAIMEREFKSYVVPLLKGVNRKVRSNTNSRIQKKKTEATANAQQRVRKGYTSTESVEEALNHGNWAQRLGLLAAKGKLKI